MKKVGYDADKEFANRIEKALSLYGLEEADLGKLIGTNATDIKNILNLKRTLGLKRANKISGVFGMRYFQFGNPGIKFLPKEQLPIRTIDAINERLEKGPSTVEINTDLELPFHTMEVLKKIDVTGEFTPNAIHEELPEEIRSQVGANRITVLFKTGSLKKYVEYANKKDGKRHIYKFISPDSKKQMEKALKNKKE